MIGYPELVNISVGRYSLNPHSMFLQLFVSFLSDMLWIFRQTFMFLSHLILCKQQQENVLCCFRDIFTVIEDKYEVILVQDCCVNIFTNNYFYRTLAIKVRG